MSISTRFIIERMHLDKENECRQYLEYLAACGKSNEREIHRLVERVIIKQLQNVWQYYPELDLTGLMTTAAKTAKLWLKHPQMSVKKLVSLPKAYGINIAKIKDFELMDGVFYMLPESVKEDIWKRKM